MNIFVIGSKPDAIFPRVVPDRVYAVNGAIARFEKQSEAIDFTGVISRSVIYSSSSSDVQSRKLWKGRRVDRLIVSINTGWSIDKGEDSTALETKLFDLGLKFQHFSWVGNRYRFKILKTRSKIRLTTEVLRRLRSAWPESFVWELKRTKALPELGISGGVRALVIAHEEAPPNATIYLIGIGARKSKGHFYDPNGTFKHHILQDRNFLIDFSRKHPGRLVATDTVLSRFLAIHAPSKRSLVE